MRAKDIDFDLSSETVINRFTSNFFGDIGFKSTLILQLLKSENDENVRLHFSGSDRMAKVDENIIMPMMVDGNYEFDNFREKQAFYMTPKKYPLGECGYDKNAIMKNAWIIYRTGEETNWSEALKSSWKYAKSMLIRKAA